MRYVIADDSISLTVDHPPGTGGDTPDDKTTVSLNIEFTQGLAGTAPALRLKLVEQPELAGTLLDTFGLALAHRGDLPLARACIDAARQLRQDHFGQDHPDTAASYNSLGHVLRQTGEFEAARTHVYKAMAINTRVYGAQSLPVALNLNELAVIAVQLGEFTAAEQAAASAMTIIETLRLQETDYNVTRILDTRARILQVRGNYQQAGELYQHLLAIDRKQVGERSLKYASHLVNYATVLAAAGNTRDALKHLQTAIAFMEEDTPQHPDCIDALANLGSLQRQCGETDEARKTLKKVIARDEQARGALHPYVGNDHARLGRLEYDQQAFGAAESAFRKALQIYDHNVAAGELPRRHAFIAEARTWLARTLVEKTQADRLDSAATEAEQQARLALQDWEVELGERSVEYAVTNAVLGRAQFLQDPTSEQARRRLQAAYPMVVASRGADAPVSRLIERWLHDAEGAHPQAAAATLAAI